MLLKPQQGLRGDENEYTLCLGCRWLLFLFLGVSETGSPASARMYMLSYGQLTSE